MQVWEGNFRPGADAKPWLGAAEDGVPIGQPGETADRSAAGIAPWPRPRLRDGLCAGSSWPRRSWWLAMGRAERAGRTKALPAMEASTSTSSWTSKWAGRGGGAAAATLRPGLRGTRVLMRLADSGAGREEGRSVPRQDFCLLRSFLCSPSLSQPLKCCALGLRHFVGRGRPKEELS